MKSCKNCFWCRISLSTPHTWKCKLHPKKRFNKAWLHGWFCSNTQRREEKRDNKYIAKHLRPLIKRNYTDTMITKVLEEMYNDRW